MKGASFGWNLLLFDLNLHNYKKTIIFATGSNYDIVNKFG